MTELVFDFKSIAEHVKGDELLKKKSPLPLSSTKKVCPNCKGSGYDCCYCGGNGEANGNGYRIYLKYKASCAIEKENRENDRLLVQSL